jgi:putative membrane protein
MGGGEMWVLGLSWLVWLALIVLAVWLVVRATNRRDPGDRSDAAEDLLRQRFASGEIDAEEYARRLEVLRRK